MPCFCMIVASTRNPMEKQDLIKAKAAALMGAKKFKFGVSKDITLVNKANEKDGFSKAKAAALTAAMR